LRHTVYLAKVEQGKGEFVHQVERSQGGKEGGREGEPLCIGHNEFDTLPSKLLREENALFFMEIPLLRKEKIEAPVEHEPPGGVNEGG
jgi:hypothetical protein